jgi:hypothetical protein
MAASFLLRIRWAAHQTSHRQGHRRVKRRCTHVKFSEER